MPGKRKKPSDQWLPPRVYRGKSAYEWHPKGGGSITLCKLESPETPAVQATVWRCYNEENEKLNAEFKTSNLLDRYFESPQFHGLGTRTKKDYLGYSKRIRRVFGDMKPEDILPHHIRKFMDKLGEKYKTAANRHHSFLSVILGWALERNIVQENAAKSVRKFKESPRDTYAIDEQYWFFYNLALESNYPYIAPMMEIGYLCRTRPIETRRLTEFDISDQGIFIERAKGSENEITGWTPRLRDAVKLARSLYPNAPTSTKRPLIRGKNGLAIPESTYKTAMTRLKKLAAQRGVTINFTMHDLKAKGISDHNKNFGGHRDKKMQAVYNRTPNIVESTK